MASSTNNSITTSSTAEYFSKNLQQVGFSSQTKAVLTTLKEAVDNALDACEEHRILPDVTVVIEKMGAGSLKNSDQVKIRVEDNGPGISEEDLPKVFGEYLASSKFGKGRCTRGQQGIGISAATTWAQLTNASGAKVISKTKAQRKAISATIEVDIRNNRGIVKSRQALDWDRPNGTSVEFVIDGRIQLNGEGGILSYLNGTALVNPHLKLVYTVPDAEKGSVTTNVERVMQTLPDVPEATEPHPHTMKLGEFIAHSHLFGRVKVSGWLKKGFSRINEGTLKELTQAGIPAAMLDKNVDSIKEDEFKKLFSAIQNLKLMAPSTRSVLSIGEESLSHSIKRLGEIDFFSVVSRKPTICDFKPVQVEVAIARLLDRSIEQDSPVQVLRFANRVPLQFDKSACAIVASIESVNWRSYGIEQPKQSIPLGPYIIAVSIVSPFIKFKNASKETIDGSDELVAEIRLALIQAGQRLSKHIRREDKANELEEKIRHIEQFGPILVEGLSRITKASAAQKDKATAGLMKLLGRDATETQMELDKAHASLDAAKASGKVQAGAAAPTEDELESEGEAVGGANDGMRSKSKSKPAKAVKPAKSVNTKNPKATKAVGA